MKTARITTGAHSPIRTAPLLLVVLVGLLLASASTARAACPGEGEPCDGPDVDLCLEGVIECDGETPVCTDTSGNNLDSCDGFDNDCNPATPDGSDEPGVGFACDGPDTDLCEEGTIACVAGSLSCSDQSTDNQDPCDGVDNDCNPATPDGESEPGLGLACDGPDTDLCEEGTIACVAGSLSCSDQSADNQDLCDGVDNDCNPATPDGESEPGLGLACDGPDTDLCEDDVVACFGGSLSCSDLNGDVLDSCDGVDNDCNPATPDGADEPDVGLACDGPDTDLCEEGVIECTSGTLFCTDDTGDDPICAPPIPVLSGDARSLLITMMIGAAGLLLLGRAVRPQP